MCGAEVSDTHCTNAYEENRETNLVDAFNQEKVNRYEKNNMKDGMASSTSKPEVDFSYRKSQVGKKHQTYSGPLVPSCAHNSLSERGRAYERSEGENQLASDKIQRDARKSPNFSGPLCLPNRASANSLSAPIRSSGGYGDSLEDKPKANVVQIKGRFSVTSEHVDLVKDIPIGTVSRKSAQGSPLRKSGSVGDWLVHSKQVPTSQFPKEMSNSLVPASILMPQLQNLFQQTSFQQELIMNLLSSLQHNEVVDASQNGMPPHAHNLENELVETATTERERLLLMKISELQSRMINLTDELTEERLRHFQLQQQLNAICCREEEAITEEIEDT